MTPIDDLQQGQGVAVIIVAGGSGSRMGAQQPKQFMLLGGQPILVHTVRGMRDALPLASIIIALPAAHIAGWQEICACYGLEGTHKVCEGGESRFHSVQNALNAAGECRLVAVHDGVRPLFSAEMVRNLLHTASMKGSAVPVVEPVDSLREMLPDGRSRPIDRSLIRAVQTPQVFYAEILRRAYEQPYAASFTDDASVVESAGEQITLCPGERRNIKITTPEDMLTAEAWLKK